MASSETLQLPTLKQVIAQQRDSARENFRATQPPLPLNPPRGFFKEEEVVDIPVQILDQDLRDQDLRNQDFNDLSKHLLLRIPQNKLNKTLLHTVLKIRVIDPKSLEKDESEDDSNLLTNELIMKEVTALRDRETLENENHRNPSNAIELERSAATYRRPRVDSSFSQSSPVAQFTQSSMQSTQGDNQSTQNDNQSTQNDNQSTQNDKQSTQDDKQSTPDNNQSNNSQSIIQFANMRSTQDRKNTQSSAIPVPPTEALPLNPRAADIERARRRRVRINSSRVRAESTHASNPQVRRRPSRRRNRVEEIAKVPDTTTTIRITTSRGSTLPDLTTEFPRGFFITKGSDEVLVTRLSNPAFTAVYPTEPNFNSSPEKIGLSDPMTVTNFEKGTSGSDEMIPRFEETPRSEEESFRTEKIPGFEEKSHGSSSTRFGETSSGYEETGSKKTTYQKTTYQENNFNETTYEEATSKGKTFKETTSKSKETTFGSEEITFGSEETTSRSDVTSNTQEMTFGSEETTSRSEDTISRSDEASSSRKMIFSPEETTSSYDTLNSSFEEIAGPITENTSFAEFFNPETVNPIFEDKTSSVEKMNVEKMTIEEMNIEEKNIEEKNIEEKNIEEKNIEKINIEKMNVEKMSGEKLSVKEMTVEESFGSTRKTDFEATDSNGGFLTTINPLAVKEEDFFATTKISEEMEKNLERGYSNDDYSPKESTTEASQFETTTFEDANDTPRIPTHRHLRKKIRKIKPISKEPSVLEDFNSRPYEKKRIRIKKIKFSTEVPDTEQTNPDFIHNEPELISENPEFSSGNFGSIDENHKFNLRDRAFSLRNPEFNSRNPESDSKNPEYDSRNPVYTLNPELTQRNFEFESRNPVYTLNPEFAPRNFEVELKNSGVASNPEFNSRNTEFVSKPELSSNPELASNSELASKNIELASRNPEFTTEKSEIDSKHPEYISENQDSSTVNYSTFTDDELLINSDASEKNSETSVTFGSSTDSKSSTISSSTLATTEFTPEVVLKKSFEGNFSKESLSNDSDDFSKNPLSKDFPSESLANFSKSPLTKDPSDFSNIPVSKDSEEVLKESFPKDSRIPESFGAGNPNIRSGVTERIFDTTENVSVTNDASKQVGKQRSSTSNLFSETDGGFEKHDIEFENSRNIEKSTTEKYRADQNGFSNVETLSYPIENEKVSSKNSVLSESNYLKPMIDNQPLSTQESSNSTQKHVTISKDSSNGRRRVLKRKRQRIGEKLEDKNNGKIEEKTNHKIQEKNNHKIEEKNNKIEEKNNHKIENKHSGEIEAKSDKFGEMKITLDEKIIPQNSEMPLKESEDKSTKSFSSVTISSANAPVTEKPNRKRVVIYRGAKRFSTVTTPSTTTVQSFSVAGDHQNQIASRRRLRKVVRKKAKTPVDDSSESELTTPEPPLEAQSNRRGKNLSFNEENKQLEDAEEAGSEVNTYRTAETPRRPASSRRELNRNRARTTTQQSSSSIHPTLRRFTNPARQTRFQETTPNFASVDDAAVLLEHLARLEDQKAEMDDQANRAHELVLDDSETTTESGDSSIGTTFWRKISTTELPKKTLATTAIPALRRRQGQKYFNKIITQNLTQRPRRPTIVDYDYYEDEEIRFVGKPRLNGKLYVTSRGNINCLDQGNFPHPISCKKFITCARMVNGLVVGTEYTCPDKLSFDPIGGICNWSAGLGCKE